MLRTMASPKNWDRKKSKEGIQNLSANEGLDRIILRYWKHTETGDVVTVKKIVEPGSANVYRVAGPRGIMIASGSASGGGLMEADKLTQEQAMKEAVRWLRNHPNP